MHIIEITKKVATPIQQQQQHLKEEEEWQFPIQHNMVKNVHGEK